MTSSGAALALATGAASDTLQPGEQDDGKRSLATRAAQGVAGASVVVNIVALILNFSGAMFVAAAVAAVIGVIVIMQQFVLEDTGSMVEVQNKLRTYCGLARNESRRKSNLDFDLIFLALLASITGANVNDLQEQNNRFAAENTRLEGQVSEYVVKWLI